MLKTSKVVGAPLSERTPVDLGNLRRGPYVWAKAEAERDVVEQGPQLGLTVRIVRPGPLVDFAAYEPPGRLGRELGPLFLAIGPRAGRAEPLRCADGGAGDPRDRGALRHRAADRQPGRAGRADPCRAALAVAREAA